MEQRPPIETIVDAMKARFPYDGIDLIKLAVTNRNGFQVTVYKHGGVTVDDCANVSRLLDPLIPVGFSMQVQSPGIGFEMRPGEDAFAKLHLFEGQPVKLLVRTGEQAGNIIEATGYLVFPENTVEQISALPDVISVKNRKGEIKGYPVAKLVKIKTILKMEV